MSFYLKHFGLKLWARSGVAPGWLHQSLDRWSPRFRGKMGQRDLARSLKMSCELWDHVQSRIYYLGAYEPVEAHVCSQLIGPDSVVVDAGANVGFYSLYLASFLTGAGSLYGFEPVPTNWEKLQKNLSHNPHLPIVPLQKGLWYEATNVTLALDEVHGDNHGSFSAGALSTNGDRHSFECQMVTLDSYFEENKIERLDLIKMDIEGAEFSALKGAEGLLEKHRPFLLLEVNHKACKSLGVDPVHMSLFLKEKGYEFFVVRTQRDSSQWVDSFSGLVQENIIVCPKEKKALVEGLRWDDKDLRKGFARACTHFPRPFELSSGLGK